MTGPERAALAHEVAAERLPAFKRERRARIVNAALTALEEQEYEQIRIMEVAQRADVALGTLYRYFSSKEHLYAVTVLEWLVRKQLHAGLPGESAEERVRARVHSVIAAFESRPQFFKVHLLLYSAGAPEVQEILGRIAANAQAVLTHDFDLMGVAAPADAATMLWSVLYSLLTAAIYHGASFSEAYRLVDEFVGLMVHSVHGTGQGETS